MDLEYKDYKAEEERFVNLMAELILKYADKIKFGDKESSEDGVVVFPITTLSFLSKYGLHLLEL